MPPQQPSHAVAVRHDGGHYDVVEFLVTLADACVELLPADAAGLMLVHAEGGLRVVAASPLEPMTALEHFEIENEQGPCVDCFRTGEPVVNVSVAEAARRWPDFSRRATDLGLSVTHALPMRLRDQVIGAVNIATTDARMLDPEEIALGQALADIATIGLLQQRAITEKSLLSEQLHEALHTRVIIEQAKGILAERARITPSQAFQRLRSYSRSHSQALQTTAQGVIDGTVDIDQRAR